MLKKVPKVSIAILTVITFLICTQNKNEITRFVCASLPSQQHPLCNPYGLRHDIPDTWNLLYHQGGNGPWIPKVDGIVSRELPDGCVIDQVHMLSRHAERYPTETAGKQQIKLVNHLKRSPFPVRGALSFVHNWTYFVATSKLGRLVEGGPYDGAISASNTGVKLRTEYGYLVDPNRTTNFWTCSSPRDQQTAENFGFGFFGRGWQNEDNVALHVIKESPSRGADTLTAAKSCWKYNNDTIHGRHKGYLALDQWNDRFTRKIGQRLAHDAPGYVFTTDDVYSMFELCGFEVLARGDSPWCDLFTHEEWLEFEYARDLLYFYRSGPGNKYAGAIGWVWLDATLELLLNESEHAKSIYFSFVHDGDIVPLLATLGLFDEGGPQDENYLPILNMKSPRRWKMSDVVPMSGRVILERIRCQPQGPDFIDMEENGTYVRLVINDGHVPLLTKPSNSQVALPYDMSLPQFTEMVNTKSKTFGDFREVCGLSQGIPGRITFLHQ